MKAALLLDTDDRPPAAPADAGATLSAGVLRLSPRMVLVALPAGEGAARAAIAGLLLPPLSWQVLATPAGSLALLLARAQPGLEAGGALQLPGAAWPLHFATAEDAAGLLGTADPGVLLQLLRFVAGKALGIFRAGDDPALAAACHRLAASVPGAGRTALPAALCGHDAMLWSLPPQAAAASRLPAGQPSGDPSAGQHYVLGRHCIRRIAVAGASFILPDRGLEDGYLLPPGGDGPIHLAPAIGRPPSLAALGRSKDAQSQALYRAAQAELGRRAVAELPLRRLLRDQQFLAPATPARQQALHGHPFGAGLDMAVPDHAGGLFLRGWLRDPLGLVAGLTLCSPFGEQRLPAAALLRFPRPDLMREYADAPHGGADARAGFALHLATAAVRPAAQWRLRLELTTGQQVTLVAPAGLLHPQAARERILSAIAPGHVTPELMAAAIAPPVERLHALVMAGRGTPEVVRMGRPVAAPVASVIVPLYRNLRFLRHQLGAFARDPALAEAELIYVLDSPEQRDEVEHMLRGMHRLYRLPLTLVVQPTNYGYGSACHAGAEQARAPVLLLLNSDVVPAARGWLAPMLGALRRQRKLAAVGPKLLFEDGSLQHAGLYFLHPGGEAEWCNDHYFKGHPRHWPAAQVARRVPGITGAAFCVRAEAWRAVGGISTDYVIGDYEDSDLCLRLRAAGGEIGYVPASELYHFERQSIRDHDGYAKSLAATYNRSLHHRRWAPAIAALMARHAPPRPR